MHKRDMPTHVSLSTGDFTENVNAFLRFCNICMYQTHGIKILSSEAKL